MSFYVATMDAERCEWVAAGETEAGALEALAAGFNANPYYGSEATLTVADPASIVEEYGARVVLMSEGWCRRDGEACRDMGKVNRPTEEES